MTDILNIIGLTIDILGFIWLSRLTPKELKTVDFTAQKKASWDKLDDNKLFRENLIEQIKEINLFNTDLKNKTKPIIKFILIGLLLQLLAALIDFFKPFISSFCKIPIEYI